MYPMHFIDLLIFLVRNYRYPVEIPLKANTSVYIHCFSAKHQCLCLRLHTNTALSVSLTFLLSCVNVSNLHRPPALLSNAANVIAVLLAPTKQSKILIFQKLNCSLVTVGLLHNEDCKL